ncbi:MAG: hypothetical protein HQM04_07240 [Magnetococcales bacterium]|nr:hypothetical protein [Magnetococcales bacterium]MBF0114824.1 hypothetical protein [Magnetococcales bacterium]
MTKQLHRFSAYLAFLCVTVFWLSSITAELFLSTQAVVQVKHFIVSGLFLFIPAMAITAFTGMRMDRGGYLPRLEAKKARMPILAGNGLLVLLPCAIYLANKAMHGDLDRTFYSVQTLELLAGAIQWILLRRNLQDGRLL